MTDGVSIQREEMDGGSAAWAKTFAAALHEVQREHPAAKAEAFFIVRWATRSQSFRLFDSAVEFVEFLETVRNPSLHCFYEFFVDHPRRVYFDCEYLTDEKGDDGLFRDFVHALRTFFQETLGVPDARFAVSTSSGRLKRDSLSFKNSFHVILLDYFVKGQRAMHRLAQYIKNKVKGAEIMDMAVYGTKQSLRLLHSTKYPKTGEFERFKVPWEDSSAEFLDHLVTWTQGCAVLDLAPILVELIPATVVLPEAARKRARLPSLGSADETTVKYVHFFRLECILQLLDESVYGVYSEWVKVGMALKSAGSHYNLLWHEFSSRYHAYSYTECQEKWDSFHPTEISVSSIIHMARFHYSVEVDSIYNDMPLESKFFKCTFSPHRLAQILDLVYDKGTAERLVYQFLESTVAYVFQNGSSFYAVRDLDPITGQLCLRRIPCDAFEGQMKKNFNCVYSHGETEYVERLLEEGAGDDSKELSRPRVNVFDMLSRITFKYDRMISNPAQPRTAGTLNTFLGYAMSPYLTPMTEPRTSQLVWDHLLHVLCNNKEDLYDYFCHWLYLVLCCPGTRTGIAVLLYSEEGAGKNLFTNFLLKLIGPYALEISENKAFGRFNTLLENKTLVVINELDVKGNTYKNHEQFKSFITDPTMVIERKGIDSELTTNCVNFILCSNNQQVLKLGASDRRFLILDVAGNHIGDHAYFTSLYGAMGHCGREFLTILTTKYKGQDFASKKLPETELKNEMKIQSAPAFISWLDEDGAWVRGKIDSSMPFYLSDMVQRFKDHDPKALVNNRSVCAFLRRLGFPVKETKGTEPRALSIASALSMELAIGKYLRLKNYKWQ